ncbi:Energy-coupling factor transporter transmembrane protein EcfT [Halalkaliarchaeum sp. AArc-CO]|uniref:energy-coupling factor transporter transmembrane component T family protein n=1 Tax=unclassified Halalkaliarchaeum TaxID=2678344 RepID=UPI00217E7382|nr:MULTISPECIES: energy-coupling factor transporter transmembrane component T [unclassified Halalkaliarchaeum]MDR5671957.1 energy-coupling factor transporter transmembrane component T [Halalkaliarchaeum sp. AArc-GB]UWG51463.1 Energy-coupling factor transporter transmembrane protein EcfT [Halalkaliarchaeum sp. AArc-CO]
MLQYRPDDTVAHRLDPRTKLVVQFAVVAVAYAYTTPEGLAVLTVVALAALFLAGTGPIAALYGFRFALPFLVLAPIIAGVTVGPPWFSPGDAAVTGLASYRVLLVLLVSAAYVRSTSIRESRAAIQRTVPGRPGQLLGVGVAVTARSLPPLRRELLAVRRAMRARLGENRSLRDRIGLLAVGGVSRALARADRLALALRARCFSWNPTLPPLSFSPVDYLVTLGSVVTILLVLTDKILR